MDISFSFGFGEVWLVFLASFGFVSYFGYGYC
jgi:hypothetical protein